EAAPDFESPAHIFSPLAHAVQAKVPVGLPPPESPLVNTLSIIADQQAELPLVITDLHGDPPRLRVPEGVAQRFARDAVCLVAHDRVEVARRAFYIHINSGTISS